MLVVFHRLTIKINLSFALFLLVLMTAFSSITALVIVAIKKIVSEETIKKTFKFLEIFSLVFTFIIAIIVIMYKIRLSTVRNIEI